MTTSNECACGGKYPNLKVHSKKECFTQCLTPTTPKDEWEKTLNDILLDICDQDCIKTHQFEEHVMIKDVIHDRLSELITAQKQISFTEGQKSERELLTAKVNRVEVIDHTKTVEQGGGRCYTYWHKYNDEEDPFETPDISNPKVELSLQDNGRTLKIFITPPTPTDEEKGI